MTKPASNLMLAAALALIALLSGAALFAGLLTRAIDGPARGGNDLIYLAESPKAFWAMVAAYFLVCCVTTIGAFKVFRKK